jgi:ArsR family transcriptional regulator
MTQKNTDQIFQALASETRLRILDLLAGRVLCGKALAHRLGITTGAVSQHLRVLKNAELVMGERRGYHVHYSLRKDGIESCRETLRLFLEKASKVRPCAEEEKICPAKSRSAGNRKS